MTGDSRPVGEDDLTAYVDGELAPERMALVEKWLAEHPDAAARVARDREIAAGLRAGLDGLRDRPVPGRLRVAEIRRRMLRRRLAGLSRAAAAVVLLAVGAGAGWMAREVTQGAGPGEDIRAAVAAHRIFVVDKRHPVEVSATARDHLGTWLGNRLGTPVRIPDLGAAGLRLVGGRLLPGPRGPAGQLMYETADGVRVTLYIQPGTGDARAFFYASLDGETALAWRSPKLSYVISGPLSRDRLTEIAHSIHGGAEG